MCVYSIPYSCVAVGGFFSSDPHLFCDCDTCLADWEDLSLDDFLYSDSDPEEDFYYDDW